MSKRIRVDEDTYAALASLKREDETFDELLSRFIEGRQKVVWEGAGLWAGTDAAAHARKTRKGLKESVGPE